MSEIKVFNSGPYKAPIRGKVVPSIAKYGEGVIDRILVGVLEGEPMSVICKRKGMPTYTTVMKWLNQDPELMKRFLDCMKMRVLDDTAMMQYIADGRAVETIDQVITNDDGDEEVVQVEIPEDVKRSALRVKTIQWRATKLLPKIFGDVIKNEHEAVGELAALIQQSSNDGHILPPGTSKPHEDDNQVDTDTLPSNGHGLPEFDD